MPKKRTYRATRIQSLDVPRLLEGLPPGEALVVGLDIAKRKMLFNIATTDSETLTVVRFDHPTQTRVFTGLVGRLVDGGHKVVVVMEPTGTYGDALRDQLGKQGVPVYRVSTKHVSDAKEVYDGVSSKHDAKDACVISWLHTMGRSTLWTPMDDVQRRLRGLISERDIYDRPVRRLRCQLEALLARHFPEFELLFAIAGRKTPLVLLEEFPAPADMVAAGRSELACLIRRASRRPPDPVVVDRLVDVAGNTVGVAMVEEERQLVRSIVKEMLRLLDRLKDVDARIASVGAEEPSVSAMRPVLGAVTAAVIVGHMGSPASYGSAAAFEKAAGLNLTEHSSGKHKGGLHISKRGPSRVRKYLFLAAMRLVQSDPVVGAWYRRRRAYDEAAKMKALLAVVRKLARSLVHVARGAQFDAAKLFDVRRLDLGDNTAAEAPDTCSEDVPKGLVEPAEVSNERPSRQHDPAATVAGPRSDAP